MSEKSDGHNKANQANLNVEGNLLNQVREFKFNLRVWMWWPTRAFRKRIIKYQTKMLDGAHFEGIVS